MAIKKIGERETKDPEWKRRSKVRILVDILRLIRKKGGAAKITHILYGANLSYKRMKKYLDWLVSKEFIEPFSKGGNKYYKITKKGINFVNEFKKIEEISEAFGIEV